MKRFGLALAIVLAGGLVAPQAEAADMKYPRQVRRYHAPKPVVHQKVHHHRAWNCNKFGTCWPTWGWGMDVPVGPVAAVIVSRGDVPLLHRHDVLYKRSCHVPRLWWNGYRFEKGVGAEC